MARERTRRQGETSIEECVIKVRQWDKLRALELIGKLRGFFTEKHEHQVLTPKPVIHHEHVTVVELEGGH